MASTHSAKKLRTVARVLSAVFVGFALFMFVGYIFEGAEKENAELPSEQAIIQLTLFGIGLAGLALAWKWEMIGGIISLLGFITLFFFYTNARVWMMFIFPANAVLFVVAAYLSRESKTNLAQ